jgi:hypothetical protein
MREWLLPLSMAARNVLSSGGLRISPDRVVLLRNNRSEQNTD